MEDGGIHSRVLDSRMCLTCIVRDARFDLEILEREYDIYAQSQNPDPEILAKMRELIQNAQMVVMYSLLAEKTAIRISDYFLDHEPIAERTRSKEPYI